MVSVKLPGDDPFPLKNNPKEVKAMPKNYPQRQRVPYRNRYYDEYNYERRMALQRKAFNSRLKKGSFDFVLFFVMVLLHILALKNWMRAEMALVNKDAAMIVKDRDAVEKLIPTAMELLRNPEKIAYMERNIGKLALRDAAQVICDEAYKILGKK